ncbi:MAG TPA: 2-amino-4-hydroxy-6-hydroxymethyldihydropteridine diphosphokinase [Woeseiaceae bacterium]|nr:2-amino-4-hydroxy-6-hydroxymethyldihydropteridine diphosphokinase [Woeseiaceae bacterium]
MSPGVRPVWRPAWVALGSNLDEPRTQVLQAFGDIGALPGVRLVLRSALYRSRPMGPTDQPDFINAVAGLVTRLGPAELLHALHGIERAHGRRRSAADRWGPRTLDLDLLMHGEVVRDGPGLTLPHPGIGERNFVLLPLASVAPDLVIPGLGRVASLAGRVIGTGIERLQQRGSEDG